MTHHCTTCNRQVLHDGTASIERYAQAKAAEVMDASVLDVEKES